jgi:hypothetical protein
MSRLYYKKETEEEKEKKAEIKAEISILSFDKKVSFYRMAIKYWWAGDDWLFAKEYALSLINGWK